MVSEKISVYGVEVGVPEDLRAVGVGFQKHAYEVEQVADWELLFH